MKLKSGDAWAQLVLLRFLSPAGGRDVKRLGGFGSTTNSLHPQIAAVIQEINKPQLKRTYYLNGQPFDGVIDSGADISVIADSQWPPDWQTVDAPSVWGVGGSQPAKQSAFWLTVTALNGTKSISLRPIILPVHVNLWGRDLLSEFNSIIEIHD